jgi:hypothetical protein
VIEFKKLPKGFLVTGEEKNDLMVMNAEFSPTDKYDGYPNAKNSNQGSDKSEFIQSNYTGNDKLALWNRGNNCISTFNISTFKIEDIKDFWLHSTKKKRLVPTMVVANKTGDKILGLAVDDSGTESDEILVYYGLGKRTQISCDIYRSQISIWTGMESSREGNTVFVCGEKSEVGVIGCLSFDDKLSPIKFSSFKDADSGKDYECFQVVRRMLGSSILLVGELTKVLATEYLNQSFNLLREFKVAGCQEILEIRANISRIYILDSKGTLFIKYFSKKIDSLEAFKSEYEMTVQSKKDISQTFGKLGTLINLSEKINNPFSGLATLAKTDAVVEEKSPSPIPMPKLTSIGSTKLKNVITKEMVSDFDRRFSVQSLSC